MSFKIIRAGKRELAIGLQWSVHDTKADAKRQSKGLTAFRIQSFAGNQFTLVGTDAPAAKGKKILPAGSVIGHLHPNLIVSQDLGDGTAWVCAIKDGVCLPGEDALIPQQDARSQVTDHMATLSGDLIGSMAGASRTLEEVLEEVDEAIRSKRLTDKILRSFELRPSGVSPVHLLAAVLVVTIVGVVAVGAAKYKDQLTDAKKREALRAQMMMREQERLAAEAKLRKLKSDFLAVVDAEKAKIARGPIVVPQWNACESIRKALPFSHGGYAPQRLTCDFGRGVAEVIWQPTQGLLSVGSRETLPGIKNAMAVEAPPMSEFDLQVSEPNFPFAPVNIDRMRLETAHWAALRLPALSVAVPTQVTLTPPVELKDDPEIRTEIVGQKAEWTMSTSGTTGYLMARPAIDFLARYATSIKQLSWANPAKPDASLQASGFVHAANQD